MRAAFYTLGCKVNQYETQILEQLFFDNGFDIVSPDSPADLLVVNSCTVTAEGDRKTRQALRRFKRANPSGVAVLTGCFPQAFPDIAEQIPEADVITGSRNRGSLLCAVEKYFATGRRVIEITPHERGEEFERMKAGRFLGRTRAFVKIQDGCDRYCSYCIIPTARGPVRSKPLEKLREELEGLAAAGYREAVLVGINLPFYGKETGYTPRLIDAIELACAVPGIERVRLGSLEPELLTEEDIARMAAQPKFCPQFHLSLQSGCDNTLRRMNRHYTAAEYRAIVDKLRAAFDNPAITTDIIVGFPGETPEEFAQSLAFAREIGFAKVHVFPYSKREGTRAAKLPGQIPRAVKSERVAELVQAVEPARRAFLQAQVGRTEAVLFESAAAQGGAEGYTQNYAPVRVPGAGGELSGRVCAVEIVGVGEDCCLGRLAPNQGNPEIFSD